MSQGRRTAPLPADWPERRRLVLNRDHRICHVCGQPGAGQVDHLIPAAEGGGDELDNLAPIHGLCHARKTAAEAVRARGRLPGLAHPPERHPGLSSTATTPGGSL